MIFTDSFRQQVLTSRFVTQLQAGVLEIDNSTFTQWDGCFASGIYNGVLRRVSARSRGPLSYGSSVHDGMETFFKTGDAEQGVVAALKRAEKEQLDSLGDSRRNTRILETMMRSYFLEYSRKESMRFNVLKLEGQPAVERSFSVPLGTIVIAFMGKTLTINVVWTGKIDLLEDYGGEVFVVDHKTTSVMGEKFVDDKERSSQMLGYTYAAKWFAASVLGGRKVGGVRINALATRSTGFEFKIFPIPYADWQIAEWKSETLLALQQLVARLDQFIYTGELAPTRSHCVTKYGKCSYFDVCSLMPQMRDRVLSDDSYYYTSNWSPLDE